MSDARKAAIHDLGYQRYVGTRKPQRTRYQVIVRNLVGMSWQGWWRYKMPLAIAASVTIGIGNEVDIDRAFVGEIENRIAAAKSGGIHEEHIRVDECVRIGCSRRRPRPPS